MSNKKEELVKNTETETAEQSKETELKHVIYISEDVNGHFSISDMALTEEGKKLTPVGDNKGTLEFMKRLVGVVEDTIDAERLRQAYLKGKQDLQQYLIQQAGFDSAEEFAKKKLEEEVSEKSEREIVIPD